MRDTNNYKRFSHWNKIAPSKISRSHYCPSILTGHLALSSRGSVTMGQAGPSVTVTLDPPDCG